VNLNTVYDAIFKLHIFTELGYSRKNPHAPNGWVSKNSLGRWGPRPWKSRQEGGGGG